MSDNPDHWNRSRPVVAAAAGHRISPSPVVAAVVGVATVAIASVDDSSLVQLMIVAAVVSVAPSSAPPA